METKKQGSSYALYITAMLIYGTIGVFRRFIPLSSGALAFARGLIGGTVLLLWILLRGGSLKLGISKKRFWLLCFTGVVMGANWILLFEAYNYTTVAIATLCYYMQPTILILLSPLLFQEKLTLTKGICAAVALMGMVLVSGVLKGDIAGNQNFTGILFGLGAAVLYATVIVLNKKNPVENTGGKTVVQLYSAAVVLIPYLLLTEAPGSISVDTQGVVMLLVVCIVHTGIAYAMYFGSVQRLAAQTTAVLGYIDPIVAMILAAAVLQEKMSAAEIIGAVLILGAAMLSEYAPRKKKRNPEEDDQK